MELINGSNVAAVVALEMAIDSARDGHPHARIKPLVDTAAKFVGDYDAVDRLVARLARSWPTPQTNELLDLLVDARDAVAAVD